VLRQLQGLVIPGLLGVGELPVPGAAFLALRLVRGTPLSDLDNGIAPEVAAAADAALAQVCGGGVWVGLTLLPQHAAPGPLA
jgi:hypothetical protein